MAGRHKCLMAPQTLKPGIYVPENLWFTGESTSDGSCGGKGDSLEWEDFKIQMARIMKMHNILDFHTKTYYLSARMKGRAQILLENVLQRNPYILDDRGFNGLIKLLDQEFEESDSTHEGWKNLRQGIE